MLVIVSGEGVVVLPEGVPHDSIGEVWAALHEDDALTAVIASLTDAAGETSVEPPFAIALVRDGAVSAHVSGSLRVTVDAPGGPVTVSDEGGEPVPPVDAAVAAWVSVSGEPPAAASELPIASGVVLASTVRVVLVDAAPPEPAPAVQPEETSVEADAVPPIEPEPSADAAAPVEASAAVDPPAEPEQPHPSIDTAEPEAPSETLLPEEADFAALAQTIGTTPGDDDLASADTIVVPRREAPVEEAPVEDAPATRRQGDHDGETISVDRARELRQAPVDDAAGAEPGDAPADAVLDPAPVPRFDLPAIPPVPPLPPRPPLPTTPQFVPAPQRGRIRLSTGESVELDRPVIIGRRPRSSRTAGAEVPQLVAVESPQNDISRNHVEITSDGETVVVADLHTTNGTVLYRSGLLGEGADPVRLHPGEQTVVVSGDMIDLGDGVTVVFEDLP
ncbi:hypothetical protein GCM10022202_20400 [Microbacterium marinilacus]|uniref:FHA domain-containing protein n=2 Tax=Microbacterium marinilacus TaxID=415209 RepID=A0ABP7BFW1_9MICO